MTEPRLVQGGPHRPDHPIHHATGRHHVRAGAGVTDRLLGQQGQGRVVVHVLAPCLVVDHTAMAVVGVLAQAHVRDNQQLGAAGFCRADGLLDNTIILVRVAAATVFFGRDPKQDDTAQSRFRGLTQWLLQPVHRPLEMPGHGRDGLLHARPGTYKDRQDQLARRQPSGLHQPAHARMVTQPSQPRSWK